MDTSPHAAFERLVAEHQQAVLRVCRSILRDDHLGADAAQETFVRLWRRLAGGRRPERFGAWLRRVAITTSLDLRRRRAAREEAVVRRGESDPAPGFAEGAGPGDHLAAHELEERMAHALTRLPDGQRTVFLLRHSGGLTLAQVAETLDVSLPTVKTQFARACLRLQAALRAFDPASEEES